jgi:hypothetical protein
MRYYVLVGDLNVETRSCDLFFVILTVLCANWGGIVRNSDDLFCRDLNCKESGTFVI